MKRPWLQIIVGIVLLVLYAGYIVVIGHEMMSNFRDLFGDQYVSDAAALWFPLNGYALLGAVGLGFTWLQKDEWSNRVGFTVGGLMLAFMIGRLAAYPIYVVGTNTSPIWYWLLIPVAYIVGGSLALAGLFASSVMVVLLLTAIPALLFTQLKTIDGALSIYRYQTDGLGGYLGKFMRWFNNLPPLEFAPDEADGARFALPREVNALRSNSPAAFGAGVYDRARLALLTNKHILIMASTRSGKGTSIIIPHLLRYPGSLFALDAKGENAVTTYQQRRRLNDTVHVLDPFGITGLPKSRYNPLSRFNDRNYINESNALATSMFVSDGKDDHWFRAGQQLFALIIAFVYYTHDIPDREKDLVKVRTIILSQTNETLHTIMGWGHPHLSPIAASFLETNKKERQSFISAAQRQTAILDIPDIRECLAASGPGPEVDFRDWHRGTMSVFLCLAATEFPTFNRWLRLLVTSALKEMTSVLNPPPLPVCFMMDEIATLGRLPDIENAISLSAGYGVQLVTVWQDLSQMKDIYDRRWGSFVSNSAIKFVFNLSDHETAAYWSESIGKHVVPSISAKLDQYNRRTDETEGEVREDLVAPNQMMIDYDQGRMLVLVQGQHPIEATRVPYYQDPTLAGLWDDPSRALQQQRVVALPRPQLPKPQPKLQPMLQLQLKNYGPTASTTSDHYPGPWNQGWKRPYTPVNQSE